MFNLRKLTAFFAPARPATPYDRAVRLLETGGSEQAERELTAVLASASTDSERAMAINKRGIARIHQGRRAEALEDFTAALEFKPQFASALLNIGNLLLEDGELDEAIAHYESAVRSDDTYAIAHMNLSAAYKKAGRHAESVREFRRASRLEGRSAQKKKAAP